MNSPVTIMISTFVWTKWHEKVLQIHQALNSHLHMLMSAQGIITMGNIAKLILKCTDTFHTKKNWNSHGASVGSVIFQLASILSQMTEASVNELNHNFNVLIPQGNEQMGAKHFSSLDLKDVKRKCNRAFNEVWKEPEFRMTTVHDLQTKREIQNPDRFIHCKATMEPELVGQSDDKMHEEFAEKYRKALEEPDLSNACKKCFEEAMNSHKRHKTSK